MDNHDKWRPLARMVAIFEIILIHNNNLACLSVTFIVAFVFACVLTLPEYQKHPSFIYGGSNWEPCIWFAIWILCMLLSTAVTLGLFICNQTRPGAKKAVRLANAWMSLTIIWLSLCIIGRLDVFQLVTAHHSGTVILLVWRGSFVFDVHGFIQELETDITDALHGYAPFGGARNARCENA